MIILNYSALRHVGAPLAFLATCWLLCARPASAQQPVMVKQAAATKQPLVPLPVPELIAPRPGLALADLEHIALASNPSIARAGALVGAAQGHLVQVGLPPNPTAGYSGQQVGSGGLAEQHGIQFSQEVVRGGKLRLNRAVAEHELSRAQQELAMQQQRVLTDVRIAYSKSLLAQRQIDLTANLVRASKQGASIVDALIRAKEATRLDVLQSQIEVENSQILAKNARNGHDAAWRELSSVVGDANLQPQPLAGDAFAPPCEIDFEQALQRLQSTSPEVAVAMSEISRARMVLERARVEAVPNVSLQGLVNVIDNGIGGRTDAGIGLSVPIPVFNRNQGAIVKAQNEIVAAEQGLAQLELSLKNRLSPTFERYANARNQVDRYRTAIIPAATESLELSRKMYEAGETGYLNLLTAQRTFAQTNLQYLDSLRELRISEAEIEGLMLMGSLENRSR